MRHLILLSLAAALPLAAQDTRTVTEPVLPPSCSVLTARLMPSSSGIAEKDEERLDTVRIQHALDTCRDGRAVVLRSRGRARAFLSGPLELRKGVTLLIDHGVTLYASRDPKLYETTPGSCGVVNDQRNGCRPLISVDHVTGAAVMGDGAIDGRGGAKLLHQDVTWWQLAEQARAGGRQQVPRLIVADYANDFTIYRITMRNSPNFHVVYNHGDGFTVWGLVIDTPRRGARNTDGVDPGGSRNVTITQSYIRTGDDNVAIKGGEAVSNITISHNHFYWGHGMSIGSETNGGVNHIRVTDLSLDGPDSGIRIKSMGTRGGLVEDVVYDDVCIRKSPRPIDISAAYSANGPVKGDSPPTFRDITLRNVRISGGGKILFEGYDATHRASVALDNVQITDEGAYTYSLKHADLFFGPGPVNLKPPAGLDSKVHGDSQTSIASSCNSRFVPFPATSSTPVAP
jgi:polygalacturonase